MTDTDRKRNLFFICVGLAALHTLTFFVGVNLFLRRSNSALNTWNEKLEEIWTLLTQSPESFKGGTIWSVITGINGALTAIGYGLLVLFFAAGIVKTCGSFTDMKKPEHEECIECSRYSDYCENILPALWIDDDFLNNEKLEFDYEKFELMDTGIKYLNPKHFSVKSFVKYCRFSKE